MAVPDAVLTWLRDGRRAHPGVKLDDAAFLAAVAARPPGDDAAVQGADLFLAVACAVGDPVAVQRFEREHLAKVGAWLKLGAGQDEVVAEVRQRVAARVLAGAPPRIAQYAGRGPLWAWVRVVALREHARLRTERSRTEGREVGDDDGLDQLARTGELSAELLALRARYQAPVTAAFRHAIAARAPRDRTLLRLAYVDQVSLDAIGRMYGVNKSTVSRWLATCRAEVLAAACDHLRAALGIPAADVESLLGLMPRDLDVSLSGLLHA
ncbi:MAG: hypothetical protein IPH44_25510 [Myxococcales bacterium]|nr:hypothetical protein [Myxococcales bacterium]